MIEDMVKEIKMADQSANQSAKDENNFQKQYITALPVGKDTVELSVSDFEDYVRADTKMQILTCIFEKQEAVRRDTICIILGVDERLTRKTESDEGEK